MRLKPILFLLLSSTALLAQGKKDAAKTKSAQEGIFAEIATSKGNIYIQLEYEKTPVTVANFITLAEGTNSQVSANLKGKPFYNGIIFHRVINDFMIQGGDPQGNGQGGPGYKFKDEITDAKFDKAGILAMANAGAGTNGSQFFITHKETPWLTGKHTIFGYVKRGQDVVNSIVQNDVINKITIVRNGSAAKKFDAVKVFDAYFANKSVEEKQKIEAMQAAKKLADEKMAVAAAQKKAYFDKEIATAVATSTGLKYKVLKSGGPKPAQGTMVGINYAGYLSNGSLFDSNYPEVAKEFGKFDQERMNANGYVPIPFNIGDKGKMIAGFTEALDHLGFGDKLIAFIPANLAYGERGAGGVIPPNADIIFEIELIENK